MGSPRRAEAVSYPVTCKGWRNEGVQTLKNPQHPHTLIVISELKHGEQMEVFVVERQEQNPGLHEKNKASLHIYDSSSSYES